MEEKREEKYINNLKDRLKLCIIHLEFLDSLIRKNHYENEQWFLDFQDKLNEISVR